MDIPGRQFSSQPIDSGDRATSAGEPAGLAAALRQCEERFRFLIENAKEYALVLLDTQGIIQTWNIGAQHLTGRSAAEMVGEHFARLYPSKDVQSGKPLRVLQETAARGRFEEEGWLRHGDGTRVWARLTSTSLYDEAGNLRGYRLVLRDVTERKQAEKALQESEERFQLLVTSVTDYAIFMLDPEGYITSWNLGAERIKGYAAEEIIGRHFSTFYPREAIEEGKPQMELRVAAEQGRFEEEGWRLRKDGSRFWASVVITAMRDEAGHLRGYAKVTRDYTQRRQQDERLRESEERFRLMIDSVKDYAIFTLDPQGCISSWNPGAERIKQYRAEEILGRHFSVFYPLEDVTNGKPAMELREATRVGRYEDEGWRLRKDGTRFWANVIITAMRDPAGKLIGFVKVTRDFSERKQAEETMRENEERFRLLVQSVKDYSIFMLNPDGRVATWNAGAETNQGYRAEEIIGQHFSRFFTPEDIEAGKPAEELRRAIEYGRAEDEGWRVRKDGSRFWANVVLTAIRDNTGRLRGFAKVTRDITAKRHAEEQRAHLSAALEAIHAREEFLAIASHELKTPITSLQLQIQSLAAALNRRGNEALDPVTIKHRLEVADRQVQRLTKLVNTLLDVSRIATGRLHLDRQPVDLSSITRDIRERYAKEAERAGCALSVVAGSEVTGSWDPIRIEQVIVNLVTNALKYGAGKPVEIRVEKTERVARVLVRDHGIGIAPEDRSRVFERFERVVSLRNYGGFGLGLWISRLIVEAHGGTIWVDSQPGEGSTFTLELPLQEPPPPPAFPLGSDPE